jgi:F-type H+-transporting ATPase subunit b
MEQLIQAFGIDWRVILVQMVNFAILLTALWYFLYKPFTALIEKRRAHIIQGIADAERAHKALMDADAKKAEILAHATLNSERMLLVAREQAKQKEAEIIAQAQARSERILREADLKGKEIKEEALRESKEEIAKLIVLGTEKTLHTHIH